jgi:hypothetical protein
LGSSSLSNEELITAAQEINQDREDYRRVPIELRRKLNATEKDVRQRYKATKPMLGAVKNAWRRRNFPQLICDLDTLKNAIHLLLDQEQQVAVIEHNIDQCLPKRE